ncbi:hypothetical protein ACWF2L_37500 [Streptomyces anulatus]
MSNNKLIAAGQSRLRKAPASAVDPAVPADLQNRPADSPADPSAFAGGRVLGADDVTGTPEEQLAYVTERLTEIDTIGSRAEDFVVLNKAVLLEVAQERDLHIVAGHSNFAQWAGGVLDIEEKYVFELLKDAARIRSVAALGPDLAQHLTKASARKVMSNVITQHGVEVARDVMGEGLAKAAEQGKKRPTAALLAKVAGRFRSRRRRGQKFLTSRNPPLARRWSPRSCGRWLTQRRSCGPGSTPLWLPPRSRLLSRRTLRRYAVTWKTSRRNLTGSPSGSPPLNEPPPKPSSELDRCPRPGIASSSRGTPRGDWCAPGPPAVLLCCPVRR